VPAGRQAELLQLAEEAEVAGNAARCEALLLEALALAPSAPCWHSYALVCARAGRLARCAPQEITVCPASSCLPGCGLQPEACASQANTCCCCRCNEALREAIALDQAHVPVLLAAAVLQLQSACTNSESHGLELALAACHAAKEAQPNCAAAWALLAAVYELQGGAGCKEAANSRWVRRASCLLMHGCDGRAAVHRPGRSTQLAMGRQQFASFPPPPVDLFLVPLCVVRAALLSPQSHCTLPGLLLTELDLAAGSGPLSFARTRQLQRLTAAAEEEMTAAAASQRPASSCCCRAGAGGRPAGTSLRRTWRWA
jgi:hypothetical protein